MFVIDYIVSKLFSEFIVNRFLIPTVGTCLTNPINNLSLPDWVEKKAKQKQ